MPHAIDFAVDIRDNHCCQFPSCHQNGHTDKHHVVHWADGGETSVGDLITLCRYHHSLLHEGLYQIEAVDGQFLFIDEHGEIIERGKDPQFPASKLGGDVLVASESNRDPGRAKSNELATSIERKRAQLGFYRVALSSQSI